MRCMLSALGTVCLSPFALSAQPGAKSIYLADSPSTASIAPPNFGNHFAVLNLDLIDAVVANVNTTDEGKEWIKNTASWIDAVHKQDPPPLTIFTRIYFSTPQRPEIGPDTPFASVAKGLGNLIESSARSQIYHAFKTEDDDVVVPKTRYYAGAGNSMEEILKSQKIDTVILSGIRTSGVILATASRLFDLDYNVYVISNNTIEPSPSGESIQHSILHDIFPKIPVRVITIEEALEGLKASRAAASIGVHEDMHQKSPLLPFLRRRQCDTSRSLAVAYRQGRDTYRRRGHLARIRHIVADILALIEVFSDPANRAPLEAERSLAEVWYGRSQGDNKADMNHRPSVPDARQPPFIVPDGEHNVRRGDIQLQPLSNIFRTDYTEYSLIVLDISDLDGSVKYGIISFPVCYIAEVWYHNRPGDWDPIEDCPPDREPDTILASPRYRVPLSIVQWLRQNFPFGFYQSYREENPDVLRLEHVIQPEYRHLRWYLRSGCRS